MGHSEECLRHPVEATNLLVIDGRGVGAKEFPAEANGVLDSVQIPQLLDTRRPASNPLRWRCARRVYVHQVIPDFSGDNDPRRPIFRSGTLAK